jgi:hypothetical protein
VHFNRPREVKQSHVFRVLIHIDAVEDLLFYHYLREELLADGKVLWRDFSWQQGRPDGELAEEGLHSTCGKHKTPYRFRDDDDRDRESKRPRGRSLFGKVSSWIDNHSRGRLQHSDVSRGREFYRGESSRGRSRRAVDGSKPPSRGSVLADQARALRLLWQSKGELPNDNSKNQDHDVWEAFQSKREERQDSVLDYDVPTNSPKSLS